MTPKEKAKSLAEKFSMYTHTLTGSLAKQKCALVLVQEILDNYCGQHSDGDIWQDDLFANYDYWKQVKEEIQKL